MTHYDVIGVRPGAEYVDIEKAYIEQVRRLTPQNPGWSSLRYSQNLRHLIAVSEAMLVLCHGERKATYDRELVAANIVCCLCAGKGWIGLGQIDLAGERFSHKLPCAACRGTGKSEPAPEDEQKFE